MLFQAGAGQVDASSQSTVVLGTVPARCVVKIGPAVCIRTTDSANEDVLRRVVEVDKLDHLCPITTEFQQFGSESVGDQRGETVLQDPGPVE